MTMHVGFDHECKACGAFYIPYDKDVLCPKCGHFESKRLDFISQAVLSLRYNKSEGSYTPAAWWVGSFGDHILNILFRLLDAYEEEKQDTFQDFATARLSQLDFGDQEYLRNHVLGIALRVHEELDSQIK